MNSELNKHQPINRPLDNPGLDNPGLDNLGLDPVQLAMHLEQTRSSMDLTAEQTSFQIGGYDQVDSAEYLAAMAGLELIQRTADYERLSESSRTLNTESNTTVSEAGTSALGLHDTPRNEQRQVEVNASELLLQRMGGCNVLGKFEIIRELGREVLVWFCSGAILSSDVWWRSRC